MLDQELYHFKPGYFETGVFGSWSNTPDGWRFYCVDCMPVCSGVRLSDVVMLAVVPEGVAYYCSGCDARVEVCEREVE